MNRFVCALSLLVFGGCASAQSELDRLVSRIDSLKDADYDRLTALGDSAFVRILPIAKGRVETARTRPTQKNAKSLDLAIHALVACATPKRTGDVTALYGRTSAEQAQQTLFYWIARTGSPAVNRRLFEKRLQLDAKSRTSEASLPVTGLVRIGDAAAVKLLVGYLQDRKTAENVRQDIFVRIAATGSPLAIRAVRNEVHRGLTIPPLAERANWSKEGLKATYPDGKGVTWGLVTSEALGDPEDLWLVRKAGGKWVDPVFTGVSEYWPRYQTGRTAPGYEEHEAALKKLLAGKGWIKQFIGNPDLTRDIDRDGYTDTVEKWLGLEPSKGDSDGDGIPDGIDKNPLAAPRHLDDTEGALLAAFEAMTVELTVHGNLFVDFPAGVKPFEITSWPGLVLPMNGRPKPTRSDALFGHWYHLGSSPGAPVKFGKDGKTAEVRIQESGSFYERMDIVTLRKIDGEWFPIDVRNAGWAVS